MIQGSLWSTIAGLFIIGKGVSVRGNPNLQQSFEKHACAISDVVDVCAFIGLWTASEQVAPFLCLSCLISYD